MRRWSIRGMAAARRSAPSARAIPSSARCAAHDRAPSRGSALAAGVVSSSARHLVSSTMPALRLPRSAEVDGVQEPVPQLRHRLSARGLLRLTIDLRRAPLPAPLRTGASLTVLDITEYFSETSGGIRTYLLAKAAWVKA